MRLDVGSSGCVWRAGSGVRAEGTTTVRETGRRWSAPVRTVRAGKERILGDSEGGATSYGLTDAMRAREQGGRAEPGVGPELLGRRSGSAETGTL